MRRLTVNLLAEKPIYHITHINNLLSIIKSGGLYCCSRMRINGINHTNIAHQSIQDRRSSTDVPIPPYGTLHDYVPFYFAPRSPMLYTISKGNVAGYEGGQHQVIHLVTAIDTLDAAKIPFVFTDGHAIMFYTNFYNQLSDLDNVDWEIMKSKYWNDTPEDGDRKRRRQAEFLIYNYLSWKYIYHIGVYNQEMAEQVSRIVRRFKHKPVIQIHKEWYY